MTTEVVKSHLVVAQNASGRNMNVPIYRMKALSMAQKYKEMWLYIT